MSVIKISQQQSQYASFQHSPTSSANKYIFSPNPIKSYVEKLAEERAIQQLQVESLKEKNTQQLFESQRNSDIMKQSQRQSLKMLKVKENQEFLMKQIQDRKDAERQKRLLQLEEEQKIVQMNSNVINIYPPINETPREIKRAKEKRLQQQMQNELDRMATNKDQAWRSEIREERALYRKINEEKLKEEKDELKKKKEINREIYKSYAQEWKRNIEMRNSHLLNVSDLEDRQCASDFNMNVQSELIGEEEPRFQINPNNENENNLEPEIMQQVQSPIKDIQINPINNADKDDKQSVISKSVIAPSRTTFTVDERILAKLDTIKQRYEENGKSSQYDLDKLKEYLQSGDAKMIFSILNNSKSGSKKRNKKVSFSQKQTIQRTRLNPLNPEVSVQQTSMVISPRNDNKDADMISIIGTQKSVNFKSNVEDQALKRYLQQQKKKQKEEKRIQEEQQKQTQEFDKHQEIKHIEEKNRQRQIKQEIFAQIEQKTLQRIQDKQFTSMPGIDGEYGYPNIMQTNGIDQYKKKKKDQQYIKSILQIQVENKKSMKVEEKQQDREFGQVIHMEAQAKILKELEDKKRKDQVMKELIQQHQQQYQKLQLIKKEIQLEQSGKKRQSSIGNGENTTAINTGVALNPLTAIQEYEGIHQREKKFEKINQLINQKSLKEQYSDNPSLVQSQKFIRGGTLTQRNLEQLRNNEYNLPQINSKQNLANNKNDQHQQKQLQNEQPQSKYPWEMRDQSLQQIKSIHSSQSRKTYMRSNYMISFSQSQPRIINNDNNF